MWKVCYIDFNGYPRKMAFANYQEAIEAAEFYKLITGGVQAMVNYYEN